MKTTRWLKFFIFTSILIASCQPGGRDVNFITEPELDLDLQKIKERGYINAIVDNNSISYFIFKGSSMGYEYELLQRFARSIKVDLKIKVITGVEEAFNTLNKGEGDIIAFPLTITPERKKYLTFTNSHFTTSQVLVQRKPAGWQANPWIAEQQMIRNPVDLIGKEVYVMRESAFKQRLKNLSQEMGGEIIIHEDSAAAETESLIHKVATGEIQYTVTDQTIGMVNAAYNPDLDVKTLLSLPQQIAWAVRKNSTQLLGSINTWLGQVKKDGTFQVIYDRYFNSPRTSLQRMTSDYSSLNGSKLSPYDDDLKEGAKTLGWDWRLLASVVYQESNFKPNIVSWAGAVGLMQVMPETGKYFGVTNLYDPRLNIKTGVRFLKFLDDYWVKSVTDKEERLKFILASYNVGLSHVIDSKNLAKKYLKDPTKWEEVEFFLLQKSNPKYYRDSVAVAGYCRCEGPVIYVKEVLSRYEEYKVLIALNRLGDLKSIDNLSKI
jgi:membrane-bound lytic murein transglycosylase F